MDYAKVPLVALSLHPISTNGIKLGMNGRNCLLNESKLAPFVCRVGMLFGITVAENMNGLFNFINVLF
jgi:hypothetical protein